MKFLADMGISPDTVLWLRRLGYDAVHLHEQGLERLPDPEILSKAKEEQRVLLTHDLDFGYLLAISRAQLPSVVIFRLADMRPSSVNHHLENVLQRHTGELESGAVVIVTEGRTRVRMLPIQR